MTMMVNKMVAISRLRVLVLLLPLLASTAASAIPRFGYVSTANLFSRQEELYSSLCTPSCDLGTCGSGGSCPTAVSKRWWSEGLSSNNSDDYHRYTNALGKRLFTFNPGSNDPKDYSDREQPKRDIVDHYLPAVDDGGENAHYGVPLPTIALAGGVAVDERAVSQQLIFGDKPFQIISSQVHGCTVIVVASTRGVWMSHLWESYSNGKDAEGNNLDTPNDPAFNERVLMFLRGQSVINPSPNGYRDYVAPSGPGINFNMFNNKATDQTNVFIFTPSKPGTSKADMKNLKNLKYYNRYGPGGEVASTIADIFGVRSPRVTLVPYRPLDTSNPGQSEQLGSNSNGFALFQYDPASDGNGKRAWRLFLEARVFYQDL